MAGHSKDLDPSSSSRAFFGAELRHRREAAGLSQAQLGERLYIGGTLVSQIEVGIRSMNLDVAKLADEVLKTDGFFSRRCGSAKAAPGVADHFVEAHDAEQRALVIREFAPLLVPGLLQTERYARAVFRGGRPCAPEKALEPKVTARLRRGRILDNPETPEIGTIFDEAVLRRAFGGPEVMAQQLQYIAALVRRHRILVNVIPFGVGAHAAVEGPFKLMAFADEPEIAYREGLQFGQLTDDRADLEDLERRYDLLELAALSRDESLALIESAAEEFHREHEQRLAEEQL